MALVANCNKVLCSDGHDLELPFTARVGDCHIVVKSKVYVVDGLQSDVILGIDSLKQYNPSISWIDCHVGIPCLVVNYAVCQSSTYVEVKLVACSGHAGKSKCINSILCKN